MFDIYYMNDLIINNNIFEFKNIILNKWIDINELDENNKNMLHLAIEQKNYHLSKFLITSKINLYQIDYIYEYNPFFLAVLNGFNYVISEFLNNGYDINFIDENNENALFTSLYSNNLLTTKILIRNKININQININNENVLFYSILENNYDFTKLLLDNGINVNQVDKDGNTPLFVAIINDNIKIFTLLVTYKYIDLELVNKDGLTPLLYVLKHKKLNMAKLLIKSGCNINYNNVLLLSIRYKYNNITEYLLMRNIDINCVNKYNENGLMLAIKTKNAYIADLLINLGINIYHCNKFNKNALYYSHKYKLANITNLLRLYGLK